MTAVISLVMGLLLDPGVPDQGQLAIDLCTDTSADGMRFDFVCGDEVYGNCTEFRDFLEARGRGTYCGCGRTSTWRGPAETTMTCAEAAGRLLADKRRREVRSAGRASKGDRWYACAGLGTVST